MNSPDDQPSAPAPCSAGRRISLCAVPYVVTEQDGQVIFEDQSGFYGLHSRFAFEWKGCGWYLVGYDDSFDRVYVPHIVVALKWVEANYTIEWRDGVGTLSQNT